MHNCVGYVLTAPWPQVGPQSGNRGMVRNLFSVYAGPRGELSAAAQYFYNSLLTAAEQRTDLSELFACVSHSEMLHLQKLGELILAYGGDPRLLSYRGGQPVWWSGGNLRYVNDPARMLREAIAGEREAIATYRALAMQMTPEPRALIERIIADERHHLELFERALGQLPQPL